MAAKFSDTQRQHAIELYRSGLSMERVARALDVSGGWVSNVVRSAGVSRGLSDAFRLRPSHPRWIGALPTQEITRRYIDGESITRIASSIGVDARVIDRRLRDAGVPTRNAAQARLLINREKSAAKRAKAGAAPVGWGEEQLCKWLIERGEAAEPQRPEGTKNIDIAVGAVAVEVWMSGSSPLSDAYCRERIKYLSDRGWWCCYVFVARRTRVLLPIVADQIIALRQLASANPSAPREHRVIRGCGELAASFGDDLNHGPLIVPAVNCGYHRGVNAGITD